MIKVLFAHRNNKFFAKKKLFLLKLYERKLYFDLFKNVVKPIIKKKMSKASFNHDHLKKLYGQHLWHFIFYYLFITILRKNCIEFEVLRRISLIKDFKKI